MSLIENLSESIGDFLVDAIDVIIDTVAWIIVEILTFFGDVIDFFTDLVPAGKISQDQLEDEKNKAVVLNLVEKRLKSGAFKSVNIGLKKKQSKGILIKGVFDTEKKVFIPNSTEVTEYRKLDQETKDKLDGGDMLVLE